MTDASKSEAIKSVMPDMGRLAHSAGLLLMIICVACRPGPAAADYPERPIRLIVPQAPGSATDVLARLLASELGPAGDEPAGGAPEEFAETIRKDSTKWEEVVRRSGAKLD